MIMKQAIQGIGFRFFCRPALLMACFLLMSGSLWAQTKLLELSTSGIDQNHKTFLDAHTNPDEAIAIAEANFKKSNLKKNRAEYLRNQMLLAMAWESKARKMPKGDVSYHTAARLLDDCVAERRKDSNPELLAYALGEAHRFHYYMGKDCKKAEFYLKTLVDVYDWHDDTRSLCYALIELRTLHTKCGHAEEAEIYAHKLIINAGYLSNDAPIAHCFRYLQDLAREKDAERFERFAGTFSKLAQKHNASEAMAYFFQLGKDAHAAGFIKIAEDMHFKAYEFAKKTGDAAKIKKALQETDGYIGLLFKTLEDDKGRFSLTRWRNLLATENQPEAKEKHLWCVYRLFERELAAKNYKAALKELETIWTLSEKQTNKQLFPQYTLNNLGRCTEKENPSTEEKSTMLEYAKMVEALMNSHKRGEEAKIFYNNLLAMLYQAGGDYKAAIKYVQIRLGKISKNKRDAIFNERNNIAFLYQLNSDFKDAMSIYKSIQTVYKEEKNYRGMAEQEGKIAYLYMMQKKTSKASSSFDKAIGFAKKTKDNSLVAHHDLRKAEFFFLAQNDKSSAQKVISKYEKAKITGKNAAAISQKIQRLKNLVKG